MLRERYFSDPEIKQLFSALTKAQQLRAVANITLIAHRGMGPSSLLGPQYDSAIIPENTIQAFKAAILFGADGVELDVFQSKSGDVMVIHDDELWRNVYGVNRDGSQLPSGESKDSYRVRQKTTAELKQLSVGPNREEIPTLAELFKLAAEANQLRVQQTPPEPPLILNIELKDPESGQACILLIKEQILNNPNSGINFDSICFCSFNHECLIALKLFAREQEVENIQIAPGIKTVTLFGEDNVDKANNFQVKTGAVYKIENLRELQQLVESNEFTAYDAVLWDIYSPLVELAVAGRKQIHASTSDYRNYDVPPELVDFLFQMSQKVPVYFKCDEIDRARQKLLDKIPLIIEYEKEKVRLGISEDHLSQHLPKPGTTPLPQRLADVQGATQDVHRVGQTGSTSQSSLLLSSSSTQSLPTDKPAVGGQHEQSSKKPDDSKKKFN